jgi:hypothetical protein
MYAGIQTTLHRAHFKGQWKLADFIGGESEPDRPMAHGIQSVEDKKAMLGAMFELARTPEGKRKSAEKVAEILRKHA